MEKIKLTIKPLLFVLFSCLLTGAALFFLMPASEPGDRPHQAAPLSGPDLMSKEGRETLAYKNETVYVVLNPDGRVMDQRIVNRIYQGDNREADKIKDYGEYREINNMTSDAVPTVQDKVILWESALLEDGDIYYEGITDKDLPVEFQIEYYLDGEKMEASALTGKNGNLRIVIKVKNNLPVNGAVTYRDYHGESTQKEDLNYVPLMVQGTFTADLNRFSDIEVTNGTGIITGQNINISFMTFPYPEAEIVLTMYGKNIVLNQIMMMIIPQLPPIPEIDMEDDLLEMLEGIIAIEEGLTALYEGAEQIYQGLDRFRNESNELFREIEPLVSLIEELPGFFDENFPDSEETMDRIERLLESLEEMPAHLPELPEELISPLENAEELMESSDEDELERYFLEAKETFEQSAVLPGELIPSLEAVKEFMESFDDPEGHFSEAKETFEQLAMLPEALNQLADGQKAVRNGIGEINSRGIAEMKKGIIDGINESKFGKAKIELMDSLADGYRSHADNENNLVSSVQFIIQTDGPGQQEIEKPAPAEKESKQNSPWYSGLWSRFLDLFAWGA